MFQPRLATAEAGGCSEENAKGEPAAMWLWPKNVEPVDVRFLLRKEVDVTRTELLDQCKEIVTKDREAQHGNPEDSFHLIGCLWSAYLGVQVLPKDVAIMMILLKVARLTGNAQNADSWLDVAGYAACGCEIATKEK